MRFDLVDLRLFAAIVQSGSISKGAGAANMALASASARISGMEDTLGAALLVRGRRGVTPTAAGRSLLQHARTITAQVERMRGDLRAFSAGLRGEIRILSNTAALVDLLPATLRIYLADHPGVDIQIEEIISADIVSAVAEGQADFGIVADTADLGRLQSEALSTDRLTAIASRAHPIAARDAVAFAELLAEPFVGLRAGALHDHLEMHAAKLGARLAYRVRLGNFDAVARLVDAGIGIAILPLAAVETHRTPTLAAIRLTDEWAHRRLVVCAPDFSAMPAHARLFVEELKRQAGPA